MSQSRSAVGMIIECQEDVGTANEKTVRKLLPLCLPNFSWQGNQWLPVGLSRTNNIWDTLVSNRQGMLTMPVYVTRAAPQHLCFHDQHQFPVARLEPQFRETLIWATGSPAAIQPHGNQFTKADNLLRPVKRPHIPTPQSIPAGCVDYLPGIVRSLTEPNGTARPTFDLFIPIEPQWRNSENRFDFAAVDRNLLLYAEDACKRFDVIVAHPESTADSERSATELNGQERFRLLDKLENNTVPKQLKQGDLVYFQPHTATEVASVSISAIWREGVRWLWDESAGDYSLMHNNADQVPMHRGRPQMTMAEKLFGYVIQGLSDKEKQDENQWPNAYKGRVRVSDAVCSENLETVQIDPCNDTRVTGFISRHVRGTANQKRLNGFYPLRILASPKLPCPEFYFTGGSRRIREELISRTRETVRMQGWKFYVVNPATINIDSPAVWQTQVVDPQTQLLDPKSMNQKCWVRPIKCGTSFDFHVDFENLTKEELQMLCYTLQPSDDFHHRLGLAKPLGLGVVKIQPTALRFIDRSARYRATSKLLSNARRFRDPDEEQQEEFSDLTTTYRDALGDRHNLIGLSGDIPTLPERSKGVTYPVTTHQSNESLLYAWFVAMRTKAKDGDVTVSLPPVDSVLNNAPSLKSICTIAFNKNVAMGGLTHDNFVFLSRKLRALGAELSLPLLSVHVWSNNDKPQSGSYDLHVGFGGMDVNHPRPPHEEDIPQFLQWIRDELAKQGSRF
jgi:hypothetical protein